MLLKEQWMQIHVLKAQGLSLREIARRLGVSCNTVNTVARHLKSEQVPRYKPRKARPTKLEPFHDYILERMKAAAPDWIAAPALLRELQALGTTTASCAVCKHSCSWASRIALSKTVLSSA